MSFKTQTYSTFDIAKKMGIPRERLREWIQRGFISPSIAQAKGVGTRNRFSLSDLIIIELFRELLDRGFSREEAKHFANIHKVNVKGAQGIREGLPFVPAYLIVAKGRAKGQDGAMGVWRSGAYISVEAEDVLGNLSTTLSANGERPIDEIVLIYFPEIIERVCHAVGIPFKNPKPKKFVKVTFSLVDKPEETGS
jgi:DNA-binding transcriptional MerR regulator